MFYSSSIVFAATGETLEKKSLDETAVKFGQRIYRQGILSSGEILTGFVQGDIPIKGPQLACINCHKRSGLGSSEGRIVTPVITADVLYSKMESRASEMFKIRNADKKNRPAYNDSTLMRAIVEGKNPNGRALDLLMPRYELNDADKKNLISYLKSVSSASSPGVSKSEIQIATIFTDTVTIEKRRAILRVLYRFIKDWNTDTRPHTRRAQNAPWHKKWHYESHRTWSLKVWTLDGSPDTWRSQLELQYGREPVFAVLGGIGFGDDWSPIGKFCESNEVPCLFPNTNLPALIDNSFYSIYFSKGLTLEAEVLAKFLSSSGKHAKDIKIAQIFAKDTTGSVPANAFRKKLSDYGFNNIVDVAIDVEASKGNDITNASANIRDSDVLVSWLNKKQHKKWYNAFSQGKTSRETYLSASLLGFVDELSNPVSTYFKSEVFEKNSYVVFPYIEPAKLVNKMKRLQRWMDIRKINFTEKSAQANALFAATLLSRAIKHLGSNFSRDYLLEKIEHLDQNVALSPLYPRLSLGPGQRFASKGAYIAKIETDKSSPINIISDWIIP